MNRTTQLTKSIPGFMENWRLYKKGLKGLKITDWCISSDYCFDNPDKHDVATFTISPTDFMYQLKEEIIANLQTDIKNTSSLSYDALNYLKNSKYFLSISVVVENIEKVFNEPKAIQEFEEVICYYKNMSKEEKTLELEERYNQLVSTYNYVKQKSHSKRLLGKIYFIAKFAAQILEFLLIKGNGKVPHWCSDRDDIISFKDGIIFTILNMCLVRYIHERIKNFSISLPAEIKRQAKKYPYDPYIRIPDIICGALSSLEFIDNNLVAQRKKHYDIVTQSIINNPKIITLYYRFDEEGKGYGDRIYFEKK